MLGLPATFPAGTLRVLIADRKRDLAVSTALLIRQCGHSARAVFTSIEAVEVGREYRPHVLLIDHGLGPVLRCQEVVERIKQDLAGRTLSVVAMGDAGEGDRNDWTFDLWLDRPIDTAVLEKLLGELGQRKTSRSANAQG
jgi:CheY-like chemotaxis protein